ncbi:uncharacterized protein LOC142635493 [Castanea sativa]|uniref:uncharacterized protein LOC142635493 n=1 Tax=Castanea sativa TaxID=21020 RepID=UPI003F64A26A
MTWLGLTSAISVWRVEARGGAWARDLQCRNFGRRVRARGCSNYCYTGSPFTWSRNHPTEGRIHIRLDKALATPAWNSLFRGASVHHIPMSTSNHSMLAVYLPTGRPHHSPHHRPFRFEAMWLRDPRCAEVVKEAWLEGLCKPNGSQITNCLDSCKARLSSWNKNEFGHVGRQIARLEKELQVLEQNPLHNFEHIQEVRKALNCWLDAENTMWHQQAKHMWITNGDKNTTFFHQKTSNRKQRNFINGHTDDSGVWHDDDQNMERIILDYFSDIFHSNGFIDTTAIVEAVQPVVTKSMNNFLCQPFQEVEVHKALKQMYPKKSPSPMKMGFDSKWITLMMQCVTSVTYSIRLNGKPHGRITPTRGLRQGDPISPFLFLFCAEGLSSLLQQATSAGSLKGVAASPQGPWISHLFFADDSIIFCQATKEECNHLEHILETYEHASSQKINREKTSLFFSRNTPQDLQEELKERFGAEVIKQHETYLGLPSLVGRSKKNTFRTLKERLDNKLSEWKEKMLSQADKEILIKAIAQVIPTYTMSVFKLPDTLCDEMTSMVWAFWWGQSNERK